MVDTSTAAIAIHKLLDQAAAAAAPAERRAFLEDALYRAATGSKGAADLVDQVVASCRAAGVSWRAIGCQLGTSGQGAQQRYGRAVESSPGDPLPFAS